MNQGLHNDYVLIWTGWKESPKYLHLVGQWYALGPSGEIVAYASSPGIAEKYAPGRSLNDSQHWDYQAEEYIYKHTHQAERERASAMCLDRLRIFLDEMDVKNGQAVVSE